jgi:hypothetical protein
LAVYLKFVSENEKFLSGKPEIEKNFLEAKESSSGEMKGANGKIQMFGT